MSEQDADQPLVLAVEQLNLLYEQNNNPEPTSNTSNNDQHDMVQCACEKTIAPISSEELTFDTQKNQFKCQKKCNNLKICGKHVCFSKCITDTIHECEKICNNVLDCRVHKCVKLCHYGLCLAYPLISREALTCHCGRTTICSPNACFTTIPKCYFKCNRFHPCDHPVYHDCHEEEKCPPCTYLVSKTCLGGHTIVDNVPCHEQVVLCDKPCGKFLSCVIHQCQRVCHSDPCQSADNQKCIQKCTIKRRECGHICDLSCHEGASCPITICQKIIKLKCPCGSLEKNIICDIKYNQSNEEKSDVDQLNSINPFIRDGFFNLTSPIKKLKIQIDNSLLAKQQQQLKCDDECHVIQENQKLTRAFSINFDKPRQLPTMYTDFLCDYAKQNFGFVQTIEKQLTQLVKNVQAGRRLMEFYAFEPMNFDQHIIIHQLASFYGVQSQAVDIEPHRKVLVCGLYGISKIPAVTLSDTIEQ